MTKHEIRRSLIGICNKLAIGDEVSFRDGFVRRDERAAYRWYTDDISYSFTARKTKLARDKLILYLVDGILDGGATCLQCNSAMAITQKNKRFCCKSCYDFWHYCNSKLVSK